MREDLLWWLHMLHALPMNGVHLTHFNTLPTPDVVVEMDASDSGACAIICAEGTALTYVFNNLEQDLIRDSKNNPTVGFDINYRELLSCAFAVHAWGTAWAARSRSRASAQPLHVHFRIDNISAVSWQNKMASKNPRAQTVIRLLGLWEIEYNLRFSSSHIAGAYNTIADAGSRRSTSTLSANHFDSWTCDWVQVSPSIASSDLTAIWHSISERIRSL